MALLPTILLLIAYSNSWRSLLGVCQAAAIQGLIPFGPAAGTQVECQSANRPELAIFRVLQPSVGIGLGSQLDGNRNEQRRARRHRPLTQDLNR